ncbi:Pycsar system effector family protein [Streptomyces sp. NPDC057298]|uniref:Pycsar system effector family protein n=1 Tax=Streptomyces sp. NPDC057298 TaxID=3346091 RepID=UPI003626822E
MALPAVTIPSPSGVHTDHNLDAACAAVGNEIARTDGKSSLLLAFTGAVLAGLTSLADRQLPAATQVFGAAGVLALAAASVLLLLVVRPRIGGSDRASFPYWARLTEAEIHACMHHDIRAARIRVLSQIALGKYRRLRRAVDLILAALVLLILAALGALA